MNTAISVVIGVVLLFFLVDGIRRGLFRAVLEIAGIIAAFVCGRYFGHSIAGTLAGSLKVSHDALLYFFSFVVFVAVIVAFQLAGHVLQKIVSATVLGPVDRVGGAVFGVLKGLIIVSLALVVLAWLPLPEAFKDDVRENPLAAKIYPVLPETYRLIIRNAPEKPGEAIDRMEEKLEEIEESAEPERRRTV